MTSVIRRHALGVLAVALSLGCALPAQADPYRHDGPRPGGEFRRGYPHGTVIHELPPAHRSVYFGGVSYYYGGGMWYRPWQSGFVVVAPPVGVVVPVLPDGYLTVYRGDRTYYRYEDVYYARSGDGYVVVDPPESYGNGREGRAPRDDLYIYPRDGQGERRQRDDRFDCHEWAVEQTGYDPTTTGGGTGYSGSRRNDYLRAMSACLEGRGYTVR